MQNETDCVIRVQRLIAEGESTSSHALQVTGGSAYSKRNISVQRAQANAGNAIDISDQGRVSIGCMNAFSETGRAIRAASSFQVVDVMYAESKGEVPTLSLEKGLVRVQTLDHNGNSHAATLLADSHLAADVVKTDFSSNAIKVDGTSSEDDAAIIDTAFISSVPQSTQPFAIFADQNEHVAVIRDYRSLKTIQNTISVVTNNHSLRFLEGKAEHG